MFKNVARSTTSPTMSSSVPKSFTISVPESGITLLHEKLARARFPDELDAAGWKYGVPLADIKRLISYWKEGYDWRKHEAHINATLPQFTIDIPIADFGTLNIHFVHKRSKLDNAIPLLFVHGCGYMFISHP